MCSVIMQTVKEDGKVRSVQSLERYAFVTFQPCKSSLTHSTQATRTPITGKPASEAAPLAEIVALVQGLADSVHFRKHWDCSVGKVL